MIIPNRPDGGFQKLITSKLKKERGTNRLSLVSLRRNIPFSTRMSQSYFSPSPSIDHNLQKTRQMYIITTPFEILGKIFQLIQGCKYFFYSTHDVIFVSKTGDRQSNEAPLVLTHLN